MKLFTYMTKPLVLLVLLFAMGVGQMWAGGNCGFYGDNTYIRLWVNGTTSVYLNCNGDGVSDLELGDVDELYMAEIRSIVWKSKHGYGNVCKVIMHYGINTSRDGLEGSTYDVGYNNSGYPDWTGSGGDDDNKYGQQFKSEPNSWNLLSGLTPGTDYYLDFMFSITGSDSNDHDCEPDKDKRDNNGGNYHVHFRVADSKSEFTAGKYLYFDARNLTNWQAKNFDTKYYFKKHYNPFNDVQDELCTKATALENWVYYVLIPEGDHIGRVQLNRVRPEGDDDMNYLWNWSNPIQASSRDNISQNCLYGEGDVWSDWNPTWTTYCPPMSSVTLEDNSTTNWGGDGSSATPYLVPTGGDIKVHVTASASALDDDNMTKYFLFKKEGSAVGTGSASTEKTITASSTTDTKEAITVDAYNYYNSTSGTHLASNEIYYEVRTPYTISYNAGTGGSGSRGSETKLKGVNFTLPNSAVFTRTGYTQTGWTTSDGGTQTHALGGTYTSDDAQEFFPVWTANPYTVTLNNLEADIKDGTASVNVTYDAITGLTLPIEKPEKAHYDFGGYYVSNDEGETLTNIQLIDANGNWKKGVSGYTGTSEDNATWVYAGDITLYAKWTEHEYAVTLAISPAGTGTTSPASSTTAKYVTASADITATPSTGYLFREWGFSKTDEKYDVYVSDDKTYSSTDATIKINAQHNGTLTANFTPNTYTVRFENLGADAGHKGSLDTTVTFNDTIHMKGRIEVPSKTYYDFGGYYISTNKGATLTTQIIDANGNWNKGVSGYTGEKEGVASWVCAADTVLYAKWTEKSHTVAVNVSSGGYSGTPGKVQINSVDVNEVTAGEVTWSAIMTPIANPGWKFAGWEKSSFVDFDLEHYHSDYQESGNNSMVIKAYAEDQTITAVFEPRYYLVGGELVGDEDNITTSGMPGWGNYDAPFIVTTSSPLLATCTRTLTNADKTYKILVRDKNDGISYGVNTDPFEVIQDGESLLFDDANYKVFLYAKGGTTFTFKITDLDASGHPYVSLDRPHQMHMGHKRVDIDSGDHNDNTGGTLTASTGGNALANNDWFNYGSDIAYTATAQTGYTLTWYTNSEYSSAFDPQPGASWTNYNVTGDENIYAQFTEISTSVTLSATNGQIKVGDTPSSETTCGVTTTRSLTAVPNDGYYFTGWSLSSSPDFQLDDKANDTDPEVTLRGKGDGNAGTLTANFALRYSLKGTMNSENWGTDHKISNIATVGGKAIGYVDITLAANTSYEFAIYDLGPGGGWLKDNNTQVYNMTNGNSYNWDFDLGRTYNCGITTAGAGTYRFMWNITDKTMSVIYPNFVIYRSGDKDEDSESATHTTTSAVESYAGGTINQGIEFRMKVRELDKWYTLCLPFTVSAVKVWDEADGAYYDIYPYYRSGGNYIAWHYIIRTPKRVEDFPIAEFDDWDDPTEKAFLPSENTPYIIQWHDSYFTGKYISFFGGTGQTIPTSMTEGIAPSSDNVVNVHGNDAMKSGTIRDAYLLENDYGTYGAWLREDIGTDRTILPFECYIRAKAETAARYRVLRRDMTIDDTPTGLDQIINRKSSNRKFIKDGQLFIIRDDKMYNVMGMEVQQ